MLKLMLDNQDRITWELRIEQIIRDHTWVSGYGCCDYRDSEIEGLDSAAEAIVKFIESEINK